MSTAVWLPNTVSPCVVWTARLLAPSLCIYILEIGA